MIFFILFVVCLVFGGRFLLSVVGVVGLCWCSLVWCGVVWIWFYLVYFVFFCFAVLVVFGCSYLVFVIW